MQISKHLTLEEATRSITAIKNGIDNNPSALEAINLGEWAKHIFDPIVDHFGVRPVIHIIFRNQAVNALIPGADPNSQHCKGQAGDLDFDSIPGHSNSQMYYYIVQNLKFDRIIWEFGNGNEPDWVHVSYNKNGNRGEIGIGSKKITGTYKYFTDLIKFDKFKKELYG